MLKLQFFIFSKDSHYRGVEQWQSRFDSISSGSKVSRSQLRLARPISHLIYHYRGVEQWQSRFDFISSGSKVSRSQLRLARSISRIIFHYRGVEQWQSRFDFISSGSKVSRSQLRLARPISRIIFHYRGVEQWQSRFDFISSGSKVSRSQLRLARSISRIIFHYRGVEQWQLARPITWRSPVRIRPPQPSDMQSFVTYILFSLLNGRYYIGHCNNIQRRFREHNLGKSKSTAPYRPWKLVYTKNFSSRSDATKHEKHLKSLKSRSALEKIISNAKKPPQPNNE